MRVPYRHRRPTDWRKGYTCRVCGENLPGKRRVLELFGDHWHPDREEASQLVAAYREVGVECLIVWESTMKTKPLRTKRLIHEFILGSPGGVL